MTGPTSPPAPGQGGSLGAPTRQSWYKKLPSWLKRNIKLLGALLVALMIASACSVVGPRYGWWQAGVVVLAISIAATVAPILFSFLNFANLNDPGYWFDTAPNLDKEGYSGDRDVM